MPYLFVHLLRDIVLMQSDLGMCVISFCSFVEGPCIDAA